MYSNQI